MHPIKPTYQFLTERQMAKGGVSKKEILTLAMKGEGRRCDIVLTFMEECLCNQKVYDREEDGKIIYQAVDEDGTITAFTLKDVIDVELSEL